ncbi:High mobility group B protein 10 [Cardamine amara subsp. amara]|uniref:High mobility group B protein 10 n=1 Tax=Cardamine amara subsp. amara TaxID=228776 RepID=A0ABD1ADK9_CARAN
MSTNISPYLKTDVDPVNGHRSDNKRCDDSSSSATPKYDDLVRNSSLFWEKLRALFEVSSNQDLGIPTVGGKTLDLHLLFIEVTSRGGVDRVVTERKWKDVMVPFDFPATITNGSYILRKWYVKFLSEMEQLYYHGQPAPSIPSTDEAMNSFVVASPNPEEGVDVPQVGYTVNGSIDAKFDGGYLVTMKMGSEEMKGVLYHMPKTPVAIAPSSQSRHNKKPKVALLKPQKPKCHRNGYNFFFGDLCAKLKPEYPGQDQTIITKKISELWKNLPDSERQHYQDRGVKDSERYKAEMLAYKASLNSGTSSTVAQ